MLCQFERLVYPQNTNVIDTASYMAALSWPCEKIKDSSGNTISKVRAVGYCLSAGNNLRYDMQGHWSKNPKHDIQFEVESYNEVIVPNKKGIISYLSSRQINDIGPKIAERIYAVFGNMALEVLDKEPEKPLSIPEINRKIKKDL